MRSESKNEGDRLLNLDALRRTSGIRIDLRGRWWHEGSLFEHPRVINTLNRGAGWLTSETEEISKWESHTFDSWAGEATLHVGEQWCYIDCEMTPFLVLKLKESPDAQDLVAILNTGELFPLGPLALYGEILFTRLAVDRLARFSQSAQLQVESWLHEDHSQSRGQSELMLRYAEKRWPISIEPNG